MIRKAKTGMLPQEPLPPPDTDKTTEDFKTGLARVTEFIKNNSWRFAKTMPEHPHWYVVKDTCSDPKAFEEFAVFIRRFGFDRYFYEKLLRYFMIDEYKYWTMGNPIAETTVINRALQNETCRMVLDEWEKELASQVDFKEAKKRNITHGNPPASCDICGQELAAKRYFVDCCRQGSMQWANMCAKCFSAEGCTIGWGEGQLYSRQSSGDWLQVAGFMKKGKRSEDGDIS